MIDTVERDRIKCSSDKLLPSAFSSKGKEGFATCSVINMPTITANFSAVLFNTVRINLCSVHPVLQLSLPRFF